MNWQKEAINDLKNYPLRQEAMLNLRESIRDLTEDYESLSGISAGTPVKGGISRQEEQRINNIVEREKLKQNLSVVQKLLLRTRRGLDALTEQQRDILDRFYIHRSSSHVDDLCLKYCISPPRLYQLKNDALYSFTVAMYGIIDL